MPVLHERKRPELEQAYSRPRCYVHMILSRKNFHIQLQNTSSQTHLDVYVSYFTAQYKHDVD